jgi:hypothetical protein
VGKPLENYIYLKDRKGDERIALRWIIGRQIVEMRYRFRTVSSGGL